MQLVAVRQLRSTTLGPGREGITFAHSEHNHPVPGITVTTGHVPHASASTSAANRLIGEVVHSDDPVPL